jgi:hypothetical protein
MGCDTDFNFGYNDRDPPGWSECMQRIECPRCGKFHGYCSELQKAASESSPLGRTGRVMNLTAHHSKGTRKSFKSRPFLNSKAIPDKGADYSILNFREAPKNMPYSDFLMDVRNGKQEYTVGLRSESVLLDMLMDQLGTKSEKWIGKKVHLIKGGPKGQYINLG